MGTPGIDGLEQQDGGLRRDSASIPCRATPSDAWPDAPLPLPSDLPAVPALPDELIPWALRDWILDAADRLQVPPEMIAAPALVSAGALVGRSVGIRPKRHDEWIVVPNVWGALVGRPGVMKSPAIREATRFLTRIAATASAKHEEAEKQSILTRRLIAERIKGETRRASNKKVVDLHEVQARIEALQEQEEAATCTERRYVTQDATVEKLGEILRDNPGGILVVRDELSGWLQGLSKSGREGDRQFFLEAWNGDGSFTVDRIGRGTVHIASLCVSVLGGIQPHSLRSLLVDGAVDGSTDDGLLQRFGLTVWADLGPDWVNVDRWAETEARVRAEAVYEALSRREPAKVRASEFQGVPCVALSDDGLDLFCAWRSQLERRLRSGELDAWPAYEAHLAKYRSLVPAIALITHMLDVHAGRTEAGPVPLKAVTVAAEWGDFLEAHARRTYSVELDPGKGAARALAERIRKGSVTDGVAVREVRRSGWAGLRSRDLVDQGLATLMELGWVRVERRENGANPSRIVRLHPTLVGGRDGELR